MKHFSPFCLCSHPNFCFLTFAPQLVQLWCLNLFGIVTILSRADIASLCMTLHTSYYFNKISVSSIWRNRMLLNLWLAWNSLKSIENKKKRFFLINIFFCLYNDILNQIPNNPVIEICQNYPPLTQGKTKSQDLLVVKYSKNLVRICKNKLYENKIKFKWSNCYKKTLCKYFIKLTKGKAVEEKKSKYFLQFKCSYCYLALNNKVACMYYRYTYIHTYIYIYILYIYIYMIYAYINVLCIWKLKLYVENTSQRI